MAGEKKLDMDKLKDTIRDAAALSKESGMNLKSAMEKVLIDQGVIPAPVEELPDDVSSDGSFTDRQREILRKLAGNHDLSSSERNQLYAELVSDNYGQNKTVKYNDGTQVDVSEMTILEKTKLSGGSFRTTDSKGVKFDDFGDDAEIGDVKYVCGGTITYEKNTSEFFNQMGDGFMNGELGRTRKVVHYSGVLGDFSYDTGDFELAYYEAEQSGNTVSVPVLHYKGDKADEYSDKTSLFRSWFYGGKVGKRNGSYITIPEGLEIGDYMFAGTEIESMPDISACSTLKSAHCMFMDCEKLTEGCSDAVDEQGRLIYPKNLEDVSWMFAGSGMRQFFGEIGEFAMDARCCAQDCRYMGYVDEDGFDFEMPHMGKARYLVSSYCDDILDNSNTEVAAVVKEYCKSQDWNKDGSLHVSQWTDEEGAHNCIFDKVEDGSYDKDRIDKIQKEAEKRGILKIIDPEAKGRTGLSAVTADMMTTAAHLKDSGDTQNNTTWATVLQSDKTFHFEKDNPGGEFLDRALMFGGTYGIVRGLTKSKLAGLGVAVAGQFVGFASKLTPILDTVASFIGKDSAVGKFLTGISSKLQGSNVDYHTEVKELNLDKVFDDQQDASMQFAFMQMKDILSPKSEYVLPDPDGYVAGTSYDVSPRMRDNGKLIADDGNLLILGMTPESEMTPALDGKLMDVAMSGVVANLEEDLGGKPITQDLKNEYSGYFTVLMGNMKAYSDGAMEVIGEKYIGDERGEAVAKAGLEKVMRSTCSSMYEAMALLQKDYGMFTKEQIAELDSLAPEGLPKFSEYELGQTLTPEVDTYADEFKEHQKTFREALEAAKSDDDVNAAYKAYYEGAYGAVIREAERQGVVLDTRGAEVEGTSSAKLSSQVEKATMSAQERIKAAEELATGVDQGGSAEHQAENQ